MTSENSFSVRLKNNFKRRIWIFSLTCVALLFTTLGILVAYYSRINSYDMRGVYASRGEYYLAMRQATSDCLVVSPHITVITVIIAFILAIQGFSYKYNRSKMDFYMSQPISASKRYCTIVLNSILIYAVPLLLSLMLCLLCAFSQKAISIAVFSRVIFSFFEYLLVFISVYFSVTCAVMLTGNMFITFLGGVVFLSWEGLYLLIFDSLKSEFFHTRDYFFAESNEYYSALAKQIDILSLNVSITTTPLWSPAMVKGLITIIINALVFCILSYIAYTRNDGESVGKSIVFNRLCNWIKIPLGIAGSLICGMALYSISGGSIWFLFISAIIIGLLAGMLIQILFDMNIASAVTKLPSTISICVISFMILLCCHFDIFGYDHYLPNIDNVVSCAVAFPSDVYCCDWYINDTTDYTRNNASEYIKNNMEITNVAPVLELVKHAVESDALYDINSTTTNFSVLYRQKNGKTVARNYNIDINDPLCREPLNALMSDPNYSLTINPTTNSLVDINKDKLQEVTYTHNGMENPVFCDIQALSEALRSDIAQNYSFDLARNEIPCGVINLTYERYCTSSVFVYEQYTNTLKLLADSTYAINDRLEADNVSYINVSQYIEDEDYETDALESHYKAADYHEKDQINKILENVVFSYQMSSWFDTDCLEHGYHIEIKPQLSTGYSNNIYASFLRDQIPDFVRLDLNKQ